MVSDNHVDRNEAVLPETSTNLKRKASSDANVRELISAKKLNKMPWKSGHGLPNKWSFSWNILKDTKSHATLMERILNRTCRRCTQGYADARFSDWFLRWIWPYKAHWARKARKTVNRHVRNTSTFWERERNSKCRPIYLLRYNLLFKWQFLSL